MVIDSSITLAWLLSDERPALATATLHQVAEAGACVPSLWRLEVANALQAAVRRKRIDPAFRDASLRDLGALEIRIDAETDLHVWTDTLLIAQRFGLTLYDAAYLELALRSGEPLATLDTALATAARQAGVAVGSE